MHNPDAINEMRKHAADAASLLKSLANENRLLILCSLIPGECSVSQLQQQLAISQSALSQHLAWLREADLVITRREAQTIYYRLSDNRAVLIINVLQGMFCPDLKRPE